MAEEYPDNYRPALEDLKGDMQVIAQAFEAAYPGQGIRMMSTLAKAVGGGWVYIRRMDDASMRKWRDDQIRAQYDAGGITGRELARYWGLSQSTIEKILARPTSAGQDELKKRQMKLF